MYDYSKLRGRIVEKYGTISDFATALGCSLVAVSNKLNNHSDFSRTDIQKWANILDISASEYSAYFFTQKV